MPALLRPAFDLDNINTAQAAEPVRKTTAPPCPEALDRTALRPRHDAPCNPRRHAGRVVPAVDTTGRCACTGPYDGRESQHRQYRDRGFVMPGFPSDDLGRQQPGTARQIADLGFDTCGAAFPTFARAVAAGPGGDPLLVDPDRRSGRAPQLNSDSDLIGRDGAVVALCASAIDPLGRRVAGDLERIPARSRPTAKVTNQSFNDHSVKTGYHPASRAPTYGTDR